uniref:Large polyvalent protein associated domain-containing protein n=1 Tax=Caulobacter phage BL57 TaxID=3348355 RepID=A0AB74UNK8_9VIRU
MLYDITLRPVADVDPIAKMIAEMNQRVRTPIRLHQGVYSMGSWNPEFEIVEEIKELDHRWGPEYEPGLTQDERSARLTAWFKADGERREARIKLLHDKYKIEVVHPDDEDAPPVAEGYSRIAGLVESYGVCDGPEQLLACIPDLIDDPDTRYFISMCEVRREHQEPNGGWRYHKWGPYIGNQNPQYEYLYDDKHIDAVYTYHIYTVTKTVEEVLAGNGYQLVDHGSEYLLTFHALVAGKERQERVCKGDRALVLAAYYRHLAQMQQEHDIWTLEKEGYRFGLQNSVVAPDGLDLGAHDTETLMLRAAALHRRKARQQKQKEEAAHG